MTTIVNRDAVFLPPGFSAGGLHCGIKRHKKDLGWILSSVPAVASSVYTKNLFRAAPLVVTKEALATDGQLQAVLVNSGNANAVTGEPGLANARTMQAEFAEAMGVKPHHTAVASTGVIGVQLPMDTLKQGILAAAKMHATHQGTAFDFAQAIMTTDTREKQITVQIDVDRKPITLYGVAKGSGMIHPNMATMLAFLATDAAVEPKSLQSALQHAVNSSFNMITVDGDTSTNDMALIMANGVAENKPLVVGESGWGEFASGLQLVCQTLAKDIARDGEGASRLIEITVQGAKTEAGARCIAKSVAKSSLVKTAVFGNDPNWGRIVCAMGYAGEVFDPQGVSVRLGSISVVERGLPVAFDEAEARQVLLSDPVAIKIFLQEGSEGATAWGCDLSYDYVKINASYRS